MTLENVCRLCRLTTSNTHELSLLFENDLHEKLKSCYSINVEFNEYLPTKVCGICKTMIEQATYFKKRCEDSNSYFDEYLMKKKVIRTVKFNALPFRPQSEQKSSKAIPLPYHRQEMRSPSKDDTEQEITIRQPTKQYTRKNKNDQGSTSKTQNKQNEPQNIVLFESFGTESPLKIKEEPKTVAEILVNEWDDDSSSPDESEIKTPNRMENELIAVKTPTTINLQIENRTEPHNSWKSYDLQVVKTELNSDDEDFEEMNKQVETPRKRVIGEETVVENHCNLLAVYNEGARSQNKSSLNQVQKLTSNKKIKFHCTECSSSFTDEADLIHHNCGNLRYACHVCRKLFKNEYALMKHMNEHKFGNNEKTFHEERNENVYPSRNFIRMESTHKRQKTMYFDDH